MEMYKLLLVVSLLCSLLNTGVIITREYIFLFSLLAFCWGIHFGLNFFFLNFSRNVSDAHAQVEGAAEGGD